MSDYEAAFGPEKFWEQFTTLVESLATFSKTDAAAGEAQALNTKITLQLEWMFIDSAWRWAFSWEKSSALQAEKAAKALGHLNQIEVYETRATYNKYANGLISAYRQRHASPSNLYNKADATTWGAGVDQAKTTFFEMETYAGLYDMVSTDDIRAYR